MTIDVMRFKQALPNSKCQIEIPDSVMNRWDHTIRPSAEDHGANSITILDVIGEDWFGEGVTAKRVAAALRSIGDNNPVDVLINSPGGDMFEGIAIYNLLEQHRGRVTVKILSLAASAASTIAMAGDEIQIAKAGFFMIHNAWIVAMGNRKELREAADWLEPFDAVIRDVYVDRTGLDADTVEAMLDDETWIGSNAALEQGFADSLLSHDPVEEDAPSEASAMAALRKIEQALGKSGMPKTKRRELINCFKSGMSGAAGGDDTSGAVETGRLIMLADKIAGAM